MNGTSWSCINSEGRMQPSSVLIILRWGGATYYFMDMSEGEVAVYIQHIKDMGFTKDAEESEYYYKAHNGKTQYVEFEYEPEGIGSIRAGSF